MNSWVHTHESVHFLQVRTGLSSAGSSLTVGVPSIEHSVNEGSGNACMNE